MGRPLDALVIDDKRESETKREKKRERYIYIYTYVGQSQTMGSSGDRVGISRDYNVNMTRKPTNTILRLHWIGLKR